MNENEEPAADPAVERKLRKARRMAKLGFPFLEMLFRTWRRRWIGIERFYDDRGLMLPAILAVWHQHLLPGALVGRNRGFGVLISQHGDGEIITRVMCRLGYSAIRGSSTRGGARALIQLMRVPKATGLVLTPDGPRGPAREVQDGLLFLASRSRRLIFPCGLAASRKWHARSWDRLLVPKPFAHVVLYTLPPFQVPEGLMKDEVELERWRKVVAERLDAAQRCAEDFVAGVDFAEPPFPQHLVEGESE